MTDQSGGWTRRFTVTTLAAALGTGASGTAIAAAGSVAPADLRGLDTAVEDLRRAMVSGERTALDRLLHERLVYMHSSGHSQSKANLMADLAGKVFFAGLAFPEQTLDRQGETGIAVLTVDQIKNLPGGTTRASRIRVIQTWAWADRRWQLLARSSAILNSPLTPPCKPAAGQ